MDFIATMAMLTAGCALETAGIEHIGPTNWLAFVQCSSDEPARPMKLGEERVINDEWTCAPQKPTKTMGRVLCWSAESEMMLAAQCSGRNYKSEVYFGDCLVWLTCESQ